VTQIVQGLLKWGQFLQGEMNQVCQRFGLKEQQLNFFNEIIWLGPLTQKELGETLLFEKSIKIMIKRKFGIELEIERKYLNTITKEAQEIVYS
jgi:hypothetical protein